MNAIVEPIVVLLLVAGIVYAALSLRHIVAFVRRVFSKCLAARASIILFLSALLFIYSTSNPPWRIVVKDYKGHTERTELVWSYLGNSPYLDNERYQSSAIALDVFCLQTLCVLVSAVAAFWLVRPTVGKSSARTASPAQQAKGQSELSSLPGAAQDLQTINHPPSTLN